MYTWTKVMYNPILHTNIPAPPSQNYPVAPLPENTKYEVSNGRMNWMNEQSIYFWLKLTGLRLYRFERLLSRERTKCSQSWRGSKVGNIKLKTYMDRRSFQSLKSCRYRASLQLTSYLTYSLPQPRYERHTWSTVHIRRFLWLFIVSASGRIENIEIDYLKGVREATRLATLPL